MCLILVLREAIFEKIACLKYTTIIQTSFLLIVRSSLLLLELELDELLEFFLCFFMFIAALGVALESGWLALLILLLRVCGFL